MAVSESTVLETLKALGSIERIAAAGEESVLEDGNLAFLRDAITYRYSSKVLANIIVAQAEGVHELVEEAEEAVEAAHASGYFAGAVDAAARLTSQLAQAGITLEQPDEGVNAVVNEEPTGCGCGDPHCCLS